MLFAFTNTHAQAQVPDGFPQTNLQKAIVGPPPPVAKKNLGALAQARSDNAFSASAICFVLDSNDTRWATGGKNITSCDPAIIESQITETHAAVMIWQFKSGKEMLRTTITSKKMKSLGTNNAHHTNTYERIGNKLTEDFGGCKQIFEILSDTPQTLTVRTIGASGNCLPTIIKAIELSARMSPAVYLKINGQ